MALNSFKCNPMMPLLFKGLSFSLLIILLFCL